MAHDERNFFWRRELCSHDQVAFVFAVFVVDHDYKFAARNRSDDVFNWCEVWVVSCLLAWLTSLLFCFLAHY